MFSVSVRLTDPIRAAIRVVHRHASVWTAAVTQHGDVRDGAHVAAATGLVDVAGWLDGYPPGARLIVRREPLHPGALMGRPSKYPPEFRTEAVELVRTSGWARAEIARSLGLSDSTLKDWVVAAEAARVRAADPDALTEDERAELKRLRKENADLRTDREILRKAAAYFARETMR